MSWWKRNIVIRKIILILVIIAVSLYVLLLGIFSWEIQL